MGCSSFLHCMDFDDTETCRDAMNFCLDYRRVMSRNGKYAKCLVNVYVYTTAMATVTIRRAVTNANGIPPPGLPCTVLTDEYSFASIACGWEVRGCVYVGRVLGIIERQNDIVFARKGKSSLVSFGHSSHSNCKNTPRLHGTLNFYWCT